MSDTDFDIVCAKIDEEREYLNTVSQDIWTKPELQYKEFHAHAVLTAALTKYGFSVEKHYFMPTAFKGEYVSKRGGATIAVLLEYDALPEIGHACGHNLIAESGLAAAIGIKTAMENDPKLAGKLVVFGTPAEEGGGGKIRLIELGAFEGVDAAMMVHPAKNTAASPNMLSIIRCHLEYKGKEAHAAAYPWEGKNALDAAVACYNNISLLRQQIKPACRIHGIITKGGVAPNIIPGDTKMELYVRAPTKGELKGLQKRVEACIKSAASATGCEASFLFDESNSYENLMTNKIMADIFTVYGERLGVDFDGDRKMDKQAGSTDMGNVSHTLPSIHPFFSITDKYTNHTKEFTEASGSPNAQEITLTMGKTMALTALKIMRNPEIQEEITKQFQRDLENDLKID
ncbi:xaa-Arg dipeptidase-like isoform X2 [Uloborus diversus]|uniref:xaa-Arg dipeptidase-like isoform X2 n=1 Tax=Uloborus diversus TaxID=327109 RepID=UPI002409BD03|nr:xaa-Arg dipeptidase-like isoform X2 [Uloborus diversus]